MKLWLLRALADVGYDDMAGCVVRAPDEESARQLAQSLGHMETQDFSIEVVFWPDPLKASCVELTADGPSEAIVEDVHWG